MRHRAAIARGVPVGAGGSRLLRGNHPEHEALEARSGCVLRRRERRCFSAAASWPTPPSSRRCRSAATSSSMTNSSTPACTTACACRRPMRRRLATTTRRAFEDAIATWRAAGGNGTSLGSWSRASTAWTATARRSTTSRRSRDRHDAMLIVDEAHATGVFGPDGRGLARAISKVAPTSSRCIRAARRLASWAASFLAPRTIRDFLVNRARAFIYATAPSPLVAAAVRAALRHLPRRAAAPREIASFDFIHGERT